MINGEQKEDGIINAQEQIFTDNESLQIHFIFLSDYKFDLIFLDFNEALDFIPHILINKI